MRVPTMPSALVATALITTKESWPARHSGGIGSPPPAGITRDLAWVRAEDAVDNIRAHLLNGQQTVSRNALAALVAATEDRA
jgi:hypothetical protein